MKKWMAILLIYTGSLSAFNASFQNTATCSDGHLKINNRVVDSVCPERVWWYNGGFVFVSGNSLMVWNNGRINKVSLPKNVKDFVPLNNMILLIGDDGYFARLDGVNKEVKRIDREKAYLLLNTGEIISNREAKIEYVTKNVNVAGVYDTVEIEISEPYVIMGHDTISPEFEKVFGLFSKNPDKNIKETMLMDIDQPYVSGGYVPFMRPVHDGVLFMAYYPWAFDSSYICILHKGSNFYVLTHKGWTYPDKATDLKVLSSIEARWVIEHSGYDYIVAGNTLYSVDNLKPVGENVISVGYDNDAIFRYSTGAPRFHYFERVVEVVDEELGEEKKLNITQNNGQIFIDKNEVEGELYNGSLFACGHGIFMYNKGKLKGLDVFNRRVLPLGSFGELKEVECVDDSILKTHWKEEKNEREIDFISKGLYLFATTYSSNRIKNGNWLTVKDAFSKKVSISIPDLIEPNVERGLRIDSIECNGNSFKAVAEFPFFEDSLALDMVLGENGKGTGVKSCEAVETIERSQIGWAELARTIVLGSDEQDCSMSFKCLNGKLELSDESHGGNGEYCSLDALFDPHEGTDSVYMVYSSNFVETDISMDFNNMQFSMDIEDMNSGRVLMKTEGLIYTPQNMPDISSYRKLIVDYEEGRIKKEALKDSDKVKNIVLYGGPHDCIIIIDNPRYPKMITDYYEIVSKMYGWE